LEILEQDQEAGRNVQMRLLPEQGMQFGDYCFHHGVVPSLYLSGDFVDYFKINQKQFGFYIADVSGHGASSAFVTVLLKSLMSQILIRNQVYGDNTVLAPEILLAKISHEIYSAKLGKYLTMIYGVIDQETHQLEYSIGGHYPNPILCTQKQAYYMEGKGFPVGIMANATYQRYVSPFPEDGQLILFSDGVAEILPAPDMESKEQLLRDFVVNGDCSVDYFMQKFGIHEMKGLPDDLTLLVLQRNSR
jgi:serine phosphatase RsbU (regulator of sigma subunit)